MHFSPRSCKGGAVYQAWDRFPEADYYAFVDADGAVSPDSILSLLSQVENAGGVCGVVGVRASHGRLTVRRRLLRALNIGYRLHFDPTYRVAMQVARERQQGSFSLMAGGCHWRES